MKNIIQRNLNLSIKYTLIDKKYIPLIDSVGMVCDNCNKLISNIATIKGGGKVYNIGFDCLDTILLNNMILDGKSLKEYEHFKSHVKTYIKKANELKDIVKEHNTTKIYKIVAIEFDTTDFLSWSKYGKSSFLTYNYIFDSGKTYNDYVRIKNDINITDFIETLKAIIKIEIKTK